MANKYSLGIDVGSTTVKTVITDESGSIIYSKYQRHLSRVKETVTDQLNIIRGEFPDESFTVCITGSAGLGLADSAGIPFVQEVHAAFLAVKKKQPDADAVIELGGEDAKIIFLTGGVEQRMNGSCAGGTGAFIDQMATLLGITADELDELSLHAQRSTPLLHAAVYSQNPIYSPCSIRVQDVRISLQAYSRQLWIRLSPVLLRDVLSREKCFSSEVRSSSSRD